METGVKNIAIQKVIGLPEDQVSKLLIFISGLEAGCKRKSEQDARQTSTTKKKQEVKAV